jgi:integrase
LSDLIRPVHTPKRLACGHFFVAHSGVFTNPRTHEAYTVNGVAHVFRRALKRADITTGDVSLHTLRHTAISRMIAMGIDDFTVMAISSHRSVRMLERYTHPTTARKIDALTVDLDGLKLGRTDSAVDEKAGGRREARTRDLRNANGRGE